jgi:pimeloyl-ACP methyl ester carboxylesterase
MHIFLRAFHFIALAACIFIFHGCERSHRVEIKKEKIGNIELAYYTRGNGEPLIMIMGFRGTMAIWDPGLLEILEKKYKLILFDNRGVGLSTDTDEDVLTISQMAEDTAALIKALGYQKSHVLGWSMGSRIALELSLKHPEIVDSLILCSPNPGGKHQAQRKTNAYGKLTSKDLSLKEGLSLIFPNTTEGNRASAAFVERLTAAIIKGTVPDDIKINPKAIDRQVQALTLWNENNHVYENLPNLKMPTLVSGGLDDVLDPPENVSIVANQIPFAWTAFFAGSGHDFLSQDYKHFADLIMVFIESSKQNQW